MVSLLSLHLQAIHTVRAITLCRNLMATRTTQNHLYDNWLRASQGGVAWGSALRGFGTSISLESNVDCQEELESGKRVKELEEREKEHLKTISSLAKTLENLTREKSGQKNQQNQQRSGSFFSRLTQQDAGLWALLGAAGVMAFFRKTIGKDIGRALFNDEPPKSD